MKVSNTGAVRHTDAAGQSRAAGRRSGVLPGVAIALLAMATAAIPLLWNRFFYFADDFQTFFMPVFLEIACQLKRGIFPLATEHSWYGGALMAEYQFALFNPVSLLLYVVMSWMPRLELAADLYALTHIGILAGGIYALCRGLRIGAQEAAIGALAGSTSMWVIYWGAQTWICALVGIAWLPWALFFLLCAYRDARMIVPAVLATALAFVSGWPYTIVALAVAVTIGTAADAALRRRIRPGLRVLVATGLAAALATPALLPLWYYLAESTRLREGLPGELQADLDTLVAAGVPVFPDGWRVFGGAQRLTSSPPMQYASWFIPAVLVNADWRSLWRERRPAGIVLVLLVLAFGAMSTFAAGWHFRMPFRLLPDYHIALAILSAWLLHESRRSGQGIEPWRLGRTALAIALPFLLSSLHQPAWTGIQVQFLATIGLLVIACCWVQRQAPAFWPLVLIAGHIAIFALLTAAVPENGMVAHWTPPSSVPAYDTAQMARPRQITLFEPIGRDGSFGLHRKLDPAFWSEIGPGNTTLYQRVEAVNGYSAVQPRGFQDTLCLDYMGASCPDIARRLFAGEPATGVTVIDLLGIERVVAQKGRLAQDFARQAGPAWQVSRSTQFGEVFTRRQPLSPLTKAMPVMPAGLDVVPSMHHATKEVYRIGPLHAGGRIVLARAWYPGLHVSLNGRDMKVQPLLRLVPSIELPAGQGGKLVVSYVPAGLYPGLAIAGAALLALFALALAQRGALPGLARALRPTLGTGALEGEAARVG